MLSEQTIEGIYPLTPLQQGILFESLMAPERGVYLGQFIYSLTGDLQVAAFKDAWEKVVQRHPVMRSLFVWRNREKPLQVVRGRVELPWQYEDWRIFSEAEKEAKLEEFLAADRKKGFDFSKAPLMRLTLIRMTEARHEYVWTIHHVLLDGWSGALVRSEVLNTYHAICQGKDNSQKTGGSYREYIQWLQRQDQSKAETFWRKSLNGFTNPTPLPADTRGKEESLTCDIQKLATEFSPETTAQLKEFCKQQNITLNTLLQGAWALLLSRYSGEDNVMFGTVVSGRPADLPGIDSMVGMFINTLPVCARFTAADTVSPWLKNFQIELAELRQYEYSPLVSIHGWSQVPRNSALFESVVDFVSYPADFTPGDHPDVLQVTPLRAIEKTNFPLTVLVSPRQNLKVIIAFDDGRFDGNAIERMLHHIRVLLEGMAANPDQRLCELPMLTEAERQQLLVEWNTNDQDAIRQKCVHQLFQEQAEQTPNAVAVVFEGKQLTYRELNARANRLAHHLRKLGVGPEFVVGIFMNRSLEMVIGLVGILKAGAAYLPLDPVYPKDRLAFMLEDAQPKVVLTQSPLLDSLPKTGLKMLALDFENDFLINESSENPDTGLQLDNLAYVIYTSGSSGKPKGTLVTHRNVARLFESTDKWFHFSAEDVWTLFHSHAFDFSVWELWGALAYGGRLVVVSYLASRSPDEFLELLSNERVTVLNQTPSAFRQLIQAEQGTRKILPMALRLVIFGGEALEMQSLKPWFDRHGDQCPQLVNMYGITETTVHVTYRPLASADLNSGSVIGIPIPDLKVYVLDRNRQPVPIGVPGELYVGGAGVARGYLNRPELTAEKFLANPFTARQHDRLYRTGDLARYLPNRDLEYLGRIDDQVKIRGFRIELGEIESELAKHPAVQESVVLAREDVIGDKRLVAYLTLKNGDPLNKSELRELLRTKLPEYMVPSAFVTLDRFPLTPNGKVDRKALPKPEFEAASNTFVPPTTPTEITLAKIWCEVLGLKQVGLNDNFFDLGGHSLLLIRVQSKICEAFKNDIPIVDLFQYPTVNSLAGHLSQPAPTSERLEKVRERAALQRQAIGRRIKVKQG